MYKKLIGISDREIGGALWDKIKYTKLQNAHISVMLLARMCKDDSECVDDM